jgi:hypothetical protein
MNEDIVLLLLLSWFLYRKAFRNDGRVIANKVCNDGNHEHNSADIEQGQRVGRDVVHNRSLNDGADAMIADSEITTHHTIAVFISIVICI